MAEKDLAAGLTAEEAKRKKRTRIRLVILLILLVLLLAGSAAAYACMTKRQAPERMDRLYSKAHSLAQVAGLWEDRDHTLESGIGQIQEDENAFGSFLLYYFGDAEGAWYALKTDENGALVYAMFSYAQITEEQLDSPPDRDSQLSLLESALPFRQKQAIGIWYADESRNPVRTPEETETTE